MPLPWRTDPVARPDTDATNRCLRRRVRTIMRATQGLFVRADVTTLKQDFAVPQPVDKPGPWPVAQRYDYLVRARAALPGDWERKVGTPQRDACGTRWPSWTRKCGRSSHGCNTDPFTFRARPAKPAGAKRNGCAGCSAVPARSNEVRRDGASSRNEQDGVDALGQHRTYPRTGRRRARPDRSRPAGDREAFAVLVGRYWDGLYRWLYHLTHDQHTAEDLAQERSSRRTRPGLVPRRQPFSRLAVPHRPQQLPEPTARQRRAASQCPPGGDVRGRPDEQASSAKPCTAVASGGPAADRVPGGLPAPRRGRAVLPPDSPGAGHHRTNRRWASSRPPEIADGPDAPTGTKKP